MDLIDAKRELLGFDHTKVGAYLARQWHLQENIVACIASHHHPTSTKQYPSAVTQIHITSAIAWLSYGDSPAAEDLKRIVTAAWAVAGLQVDNNGEAVQEAQVQFAEMQQTLFGVLSD